MATSGSFYIPNKEAMRHLIFSWELKNQNYDKNQSTITWKLVGAGEYPDPVPTRIYDVVIEDEVVFTTNKEKIPVSNGTTIASGEYPITHDEYGKKTFSVSVRAGISVNFVSASTSSAWSLPNMDRVSTLTASDGTLGVEQILTVKRASEILTHSIDYTCGDSGYGEMVTERTLKEEIPFTPPLELAVLYPNSEEVQIDFRITSYSVNTPVGGQTVSIKCKIPEEIVPSCSLKIEDAKGYVNTYGVYIQNASKLSVEMQTEEGGGSPIDYCQISSNGIAGGGFKETVYSVDENGKAYFETETLSRTGFVTVNGTVVDKRGRYGETSENIRVIPYSPPHISKLAVKRCNADGTENDQGEYVKVTFSGTITRLEGQYKKQNSASYSVRYKKSTDVLFTEEKLTAYDGQFIVNDGTCIFEADSGSSYDVELVASDDFYDIPKTTSASNGFTMMHWTASGKGMGIGKVAEVDGLLDIGLKTRHKGGLLPLVMEDQTDVNTLLTPNQYIGNRAFTYSNLPAGDYNTFAFEVLSGGSNGQIIQRCTTIGEIVIVYHRSLIDDVWSNWGRESCVTILGSAKFNVSTGYVTWTPPDGWVEETGAHLSFKVPEYPNFSKITIGNKNYTVVASNGETSSDAWSFASGALAEFALDCENLKAYRLGDIPCSGTKMTTVMTDYYVQANNETVISISYDSVEDMADYNGEALISFFCGIVGAANSAAITKAVPICGMNGRVESVRVISTAAQMVNVCIGVIYQ